MTTVEYRVRLRRPHPRQAEFVDSPVKRIYVRAGRRGGKTTGLAIKAVKRFMRGGRVLYATPTGEQVETFWNEVKRALAEPIAAGIYHKNETLHVITLPGNVLVDGSEADQTIQRIRAKTAYNADTLRGDSADLLILDEYQLMNEDAWELVGAPMLLDRDGDAVFVFTPPSLRTRTITRARDPMHAVKAFRKAAEDKSGRSMVLHFRSADNPHISQEALSKISKDMTALAYRQEIEAEDIDEIPGALWKRDDILYAEPPHAINAEGQDIGRDLVRVAVGVDPAGSTPGGDKIGILICAKGSDGNGYVLDDRTIHGLPDVWARRSIAAYHEFRAGKIVAESNFGGEMVRDVISTRDPSVPVELVPASRGKAVRAEPVSALYEQHRVFHVRAFPELEEELVSWSPETGRSPNRLDALVWAFTELMVTGGSPNVRWL